MTEAGDGGKDDDGGDDDEAESVDEGGEDSGAAPAVGFGAGGRLRFEVYGQPGEKKSEEVAEIVSGLGEKGEGVGADSGGDEKNDVGESEDESHAQEAVGEGRMGVSAGMAAMRVHGWSVRRGEAEGQA
jgi:hypothetical protein